MRKGPSIGTDFLWKLKMIVDSLEYYI